MSVDSNSLTLSEYAVLSNDPLVQKVVFSLLEMGNVLEDIPLVTKRTLVANGVRWQDNLPSVNWAKINEQPVATKGKPTPFSEQVYLVRNNIDVDNKLIADQNQIVDPRGVQVQAYLRSFTYDLNDKFINNDHQTGDSDAPIGLRQRIMTDPVTGITNEYGVNQDMAIDAGGVVMTKAMTATNAADFLEAVDTLLSYMGDEEGNGVVLYMNDTLKRRFLRAVRTLGAGAGFRTDQDAFGRTIERYRSARVRDIGRKADQDTRIISPTETAAGLPGSSNYTSIYAVRYGDEYMTGWQFDEFQPRDLGLLNDGVISRIVFDWAFGLMQSNTRSIGRIYDIKVS